MIHLQLTAEADGRLTTESRERIRSAVASQLGVTGDLGRSLADRLERAAAKQAEQELHARQWRRTLSRALKVLRAGSKTIPRRK